MRTTAEKGWIKIHRSIMDNWVFDDPKSLKAWVYLLMIVNHEENKMVFDGKLIKVKCGQTVTSIKKLSKELGYHWGTVDKIIKNFILDDMVELEHIGRACVITITNYQKYQNVQRSVQNKRGNYTANEIGDERGDEREDEREPQRGDERGDERQTRRIDTDKNDVKNDTRTKETAKRKSFDWGKLE